MNKEFLELLANALQIYNTMLLEGDYKNDDIMRALQEQNEKFFTTIIEKLDKILEKLDER